jgi:carboxypeptidase PM20D1
VQQRISKRLRDTNGLDVTIAASAAVSPPSPSDLDSAPGRRLGGIIRQLFPDAVVVPVVAPGATDSRHFGGLADQIFRFGPLHLSPEDLASIHGVNERVTVGGLRRAFEFYVNYLREAGK